MSKTDEVSTFSRAYNRVGETKKYTDSYIISHNDRTVKNIEEKMNLEDVCGTAPGKTPLPLMRSLGE